MLVGPGPGQGQGYHMVVRDGDDDGISDTDDGDYVPSKRRRPFNEELASRSSSPSPLMLLLPREDLTMDFPVSASASSRNSVNFKGDKDVPVNQFKPYDTPYDTDTPFGTSHDRDTPSPYHPTPDHPSHMSKINNGGESLTPGGGRLGPGGGRLGPGGGRLSMHSLGTTLSNDSENDDDFMSLAGSGNMNSRVPGVAWAKPRVSADRQGLVPAQGQGLSKRRKAMMLSEHPVWGEMTGTLHAEGAHPIALSLPDINMNIHTSAAAGKLNPLTNSNPYAPPYYPTSL